MVKDSNALDLDELVEHDLREVGLKPIMDLVAQHSWWVSPKVYKEIQVVYPKTRRRRGTKEKRNDVINGIRLWNNEPANHAFWMALGEGKDRVKNFYVCHIYPGSVWNPDHFTNLANLTAFPKSLQSLSEWKPVQDLLKYHSFKTYGYTGPNNVSLHEPVYYPKTWRHGSDPPTSRIDMLVKRLKEQAEKRPQFMGLEGNKVEMGIH